MKTAVLFPGQGSQEKGMGKALAERFPDSMEFWKLAEKASGHALREIYWEGDEATQAETRYLQPAMTVVNVSLWVWLEAQAAHTLDAAFLAGHSLGEFSALAASRAMALKDVLDLVSLRGRLMAEAGKPDESMAAVLKLSQEQVEEVVRQAADKSGLELRIANYNSPGQYVLSGKRPAIESAGELVKALKGRLVPLAVSGAFHSPLMAEAAKEFDAALKKVDVRSPRIPIVFNATGEPEDRDEAVRGLISRQMTSSVLWTKAMASMWAGGARRFVEFGPKGVLTRLVKPNVEAAAGKDAEFEALNIPGLDEALAFIG